MQSLFNDHLQFKSNTFANLKTDRQKWNFINEARNSQRCKTSIPSLKNSFKDVITNQTSIANLLDNKLSKFGDYLGSFSNYIETFKFATKKSFKFQPISIYKSQKVLRSLNCNKPMGPSNIPAWALKDCIKIIAEPLTLINSFLDEGCSPNHLKQAHVIPVFKNGDVEDPINYR